MYLVIDTAPLMLDEDEEKRGIRRVFHFNPYFGWVWDDLHVLKKAVRSKVYAAELRGGGAHETPHTSIMTNKTWNLKERNFPGGLHEWFQMNTITLEGSLFVDLSQRGLKSAWYSLTLGCQYKVIRQTTADHPSGEMKKSLWPAHRYGSDLDLYGKVKSQNLCVAGKKNLGNKKGDLTLLIPAWRMFPNGIFNGCAGACWGHESMVTEHGLKEWAQLCSCDRKCLSPKFSKVFYISRFTLGLFRWSVFCYVKPFLFRMGGRG